MIDIKLKTLREDVKPKLGKKVKSYKKWKIYKGTNKDDDYYENLIPIKESAFDDEYIIELVKMRFETGYQLFDDYDSFINDEDIVTLNNLFADLINGISNVVDSFGGLGPMVLTLVGLFS